MNLQVPPELEAKLTRLAAETGRTADQVAIDLLASSVDHDDWFRGEVEKSRAAAREGRLLEHDDVVARMDQRSGSLSIVLHAIEGLRAFPNPARSATVAAVVAGATRPATEEEP